MHRIIFYLNERKLSFVGEIRLLTIQKKYATQLISSINEEYHLKMNDNWEKQTKRDGSASSPISQGGRKQEDLKSNSLHFILIQHLCEPKRPA